MKLLISAAILSYFFIGASMACEKYFYSLSENEIKVLLKNAENISKGDNISDAVLKLGDKYKKIKIFDKKGEYLGHRYRYVMRQKEESLSNEVHDEYIVIYSDTGDKVVTQIFIKHARTSTADTKDNKGQPIVDNNSD